MRKPLTQSAAKEQGTSQFGNHMIFGKWFIVVLQTPKNFEFRNSLELSEKSNSSRCHAFTEMISLLAFCCLFLSISSFSNSIN